VPLPPGFLGLSTCGRIFDTTGAPNVILGTKWPSICAVPKHVRHVSFLAGPHIHLQYRGTGTGTEYAQFGASKLFLTAGMDVSTYDIDMEPIAPVAHGLGAFVAELGEVGAQDRGRDNRGRRHVGLEGGGAMGPEGPGKGDDLKSAKREKVVRFRGIWTKNLE
jgi:hypothetical protein